jgi:hypothetical protein
MGKKTVAKDHGDKPRIPNRQGVIDRISQFLEKNV